MSTAQRSFLILSTGQNIANLPPLLAEAQPHDTIIWLESRIARERQWTNGVERALHRHGYRHQTRLAYEDQPQEFAHALQKLNSQHITLIGNGGTKMQLLDIWQKLYPLPVNLLYGQDSKVGYEKRQPEQATQNLFYPDQPSLTLADVLECSGFIFFPEGQKAPTQVWPVRQNQPPLQPLMPAYGVEPQATLQFHQQHHQWNRIQQSGDNSLPDYMTAWSLADEQTKRRWLNGISPILPIYAKKWPNYKIKHSNPDPGAWLWQHNQQQDAQIKSLYGATQHFLHTVQQRQQKSNLTPPQQSLGTVFEQAVLQRLLHWLQQNHKRYTPLIAEIHHGVKISPRQTPERIDAEFDILILLRNGILLHLECKSHQATQKDLDARLAAMWLSASRLARLIVVTPVYTDMYDQPWAQTSYALYQRVRERPDKAQAIAFTLPGQARQWPREATSDPVEIPEFESELERLLERYRLNEI